MSTSRRGFLKSAAVGAAAMALSKNESAAAATRSYDISIAAWSFHKAIQKGEITTLDLPKIARERYDINGIELVNQLMEHRSESFEDMKPYLDQLAQNAADHNVKNLLIMIDGEGSIGSEKESDRETAVVNHQKWIDIAKYLGCHSIRMNWAGAPRDLAKQGQEAIDNFIKISTPGLRAICDYGDANDMFVIIENHGGVSSLIKPLTDLMKSVDHPRFGILPDFGNIYEEDYYEAVDAFMPYVHKAVSAKCYDFDPTTGLETKLDYPRLIEIVCDKHGYDGFIGIEYEGDRLDEYAGVLGCRDLLLKLKTA